MAIGETYFGRPVPQEFQALLPSITPEPPTRTQKQCRRIHHLETSTDERVLANKPIARHLPGPVPLKQMPSRPRRILISTRSHGPVKTPNLSPEQYNVALTSSELSDQHICWSLGLEQRRKILVPWTKGATTLGAKVSSISIKVIPSPPASS